MTRHTYVTVELPEALQTEAMRNGDEPSEIEVEVQFETFSAEPDVGIMYAYTEDHTLHGTNNAGEYVRLTDLEKSLAQSTWDDIIEHCNNVVADSYDDYADYAYERSVEAA